MARKKVVLAGIALLGVPSTSLALFPMVQAAITAVLGLGLSFLLFAVAGRGAAALFGQGLPDGAQLAIITLPQGAAISAPARSAPIGSACTSDGRRS